MQLKVIDLKIELSSKYSCTEKKEHQFCKTLLENFNYTKADQEMNHVISQYLLQLTSNFIP